MVHAPWNMLSLFGGDVWGDVVDDADSDRSPPDWAVGCDESGPLDVQSNHQKLM